MSRKPGRGLASLLFEQSGVGSVRHNLRDCASTPLQPGSPAVAEGVCVERFIILSTAHVTVASAALLDSWSNDHAAEAPTLVAKCARGWFLSVGMPNSLQDERWPSDLTAAVLLALRWGASLIHFDCDAPVHKGLRTYEW